MNEKLMERLGETIITLEFALKDVNVLLNALNIPSQTPTMILSAFIQGIQKQATPQVEKANSALEAISENKDEPQATA